MKELQENVKLISIRELKGKKFYIPAYQRGFRWNKQQVKELIDDLYKFAVENFSNQNKLYCLQSIVLMKKDENTYEVIDGQQRLTAIWLLYICYNLTTRYKNNRVSYDIEYEGKEQYNAFIKTISSLTDIKELPSTIDNRDIDSCNLLNILNYIRNDYIYVASNGVESGIDDVLPEILHRLFANDKGNDIKFIWDELSYEETGAETKEMSSVIIDKFANINANKIALTEAELIKAHLLSNISDKPAAAHMWETIEHGLNNDHFWYFFALNDGKYQTRIDYLFDIWYKKSNITVEPGEHEISRAAQAKIDNKDGEENAKELWQEIVCIYETLLDWYDDYFLYHTIGLLIAISDKDDAAGLIKDLYNDYCGNDDRCRTKTAFNKSLLERIMKNSSLKKILTADGNGTELVETIDPGSLSYDDSDDKKTIKNLLLLYNIALLVNAQSTSPHNKYERFPFDYYKTYPIEIEHINPQNPNGSDYDKKDHVDWARETMRVYLHENAANNNEVNDLCEKLNMSEENKPKDVELTDADIMNIEKWSGIHSFDNLTLLDKDLNIRYSNNDFNIKRDHILYAVFGLPIPNDKKDEQTYYSKSVVFPGTKWVFLREYADPGSGENSNKIYHNYWSKKDKEAYIKSIQESISTYLRCLIGEADGKE